MQATLAGTRPRRKNGWMLEAEATRERERDARINICRINISGGAAPFERPLYCSIMADNRAHYDFFNRVHDQVSAFLFVPWGGGGWGKRRLEKLLDGSIVGFKNGRILMGSWLVES